MFDVTCTGSAPGDLYSEFSDHHSTITSVELPATIVNQSTCVTVLKPVIDESPKATGIGRMEPATS
jgi:hypothetical protein